jgi:hypothetical protein
MARSRNSAGGSEFVWDLLWSDSVSQPDVVERLVVVDISPVGTTPGSHIGAFIAAMKAVEIPEKVPHSQARKLADKQLSSVVKVTHAPPPFPHGVCQRKSGGWASQGAPSQLPGLPTGSGHSAVPAH